MATGARHLFRMQECLGSGAALIKRDAGERKCRAPAMVDELALNQALARVMDVGGEINGYLERTAPWREAKASRLLRTVTILYTACEALRLVSVLLQSVLPPSASDGRMGEL